MGPSIFSSTLSKEEMSMEEEDEEQRAIIVGGGTSGLAAAACLNLLSIPNLVLEREDCFASLWKKKTYDRLHLHLAKQVCQLPHMTFPSSYPKYVPRDQFLHYLDSYVSHFNINPLCNTLVESAAYDEASGRWRVKAKNTCSGDVEEFRGRFLVLATGESSDAFVPEVEGLSGFTGEWIHSTQYKSGKEYKGKSVLVVGSGNSGMEIAFGLCNCGARTSIVVRSPIHILSKEMMDWTPFLLKHLSMEKAEWVIVMLSKLWYGDLSKYGIGRPEEGPFTMKRKYGKYPIIDVGTHAKIKSGEIQVLPAVSNVRGNEVVFENGSSHPFDVIVFATGFKRSTWKWLQGGDGFLDNEGFANPSSPNHWKGKNGLYCVGLARRGFYGAAIEAQNVADDIKKLL
ncbi:probable indole-3-pyruvate monooxygenase YUCCA10 [Malania oleifera]|uniref:probable indole-3-pyruvate monooxygenase YUCCA10 n=1 Tax=Malania oleifera TaxID=397392 RepID=UPI0025AECAA5|nr:probable indole-3-pyruvate monooxygenase YUCCA10 [Malania oleifera]